MTLAPAKADRLVLQAPSDMGIRNTDRKCTLYAPHTLLDRVDLPDGTFVDEIFPDEFDLAATQDRTRYFDIDYRTAIRDRAAELLPHGPLLSIGGDHSITFPLLDAAREQYPNLQVVWIDAHYDLKEVRIDAGVPHDAVLRAALDNGLGMEDILFIGVREEDPDEQAFLADHDPVIISTEAVARQNLSDLIAERLDDRPTYVSFDIDVLDAAAAPGTTFPSRDGLDVEDALELVDVLQRQRIIGSDLVEVAPPLDKEEKTVKAAQRILEYLVKVLG
ncbi:MAG: arginase family protein [Candidatus Nanohaloarchaea archaeon]|nr:arginase family protein [Candidatus Nanohaloarchaea archaeon]